MRKAVFVLASAMMLLRPEITHANKKATPLPSMVVSAKTIYVENQTTEAELQNAVYMDLTKWGRFQIVENPQKADCVLRISNSNHVKFVPADEKTPVYDSGPGKAATSLAEEDEVPPGYTRITLVDPKTGKSLWADDRKTNNPESTRHLLDGLRSAIDQKEKEHGGK